MKETKCPHCHKELTISLSALNTCSHCNANFYVYRDGQVIEIENPKPQTQPSNITTKPHPIVDELKCTLCEHCLKKCPQKAVYKRNGLILIDTAKCNNCRKCPSICPENAIN